ncbi:MAG: hypothetical protein HZB85_00865 [Deltaproteobacteria bacterium]|nr:hypothetical protein [Deltaproteobacteria bacterium]
MITMRTVSRLFEKNRRLSAGIALIIILASLILIRAGYRYHLSVRQEIETKAELYSISAAFLSDSSGVEELLRSAEKKADTFEKGLLAAERPPVAAAKLQKAFREISKKRGVVVSSERMLPFSEEGVYLKIPVEFQFRAEMYQVKDMMYDIISSPMVIGVRRLKLRPEDSRNPIMLDVVMTVEGAMKKGIAEDSYRR